MLDSRMAAAYAAAAISVVGAGGSWFRFCDVGVGSNGDWGHLSSLCARTVGDEVLYRRVCRKSGDFFGLPGKASGNFTRT